MFNESHPILGFQNFHSMKQTNNAIKFLMAQYRAIFRNANLKMFLAAATAAAALAAGQSNAAGLANWKDIVDGNSYDATADNEQKKLEISGSDKNNTHATGFEITVSGTGHIIKGAAGYASFDVTGDKASITLSGDAAASSDLTIGTSTKDQHAIVTIKNFTNQGGTLKIVGEADAPSQLSANQIQIGSSGKAASGPAVAVVELQANSIIGDKDLTERFEILSGGELKFSGAASQAESKQGFLVNGGAISTVKQAAGNLSGTVTMSGGKISVVDDSSLTFNNGLIIESGAVDLVGADKAGNLNVTGPLTVKKGTIDVKTGTKSGGALAVDGITKFTGGTLNIASKGSVTLKGNAEFASGSLGTLAADAEVKVDTSNRDVILDIYQADLKKVMGAAFEASGNNDFKVRISDPGDELDLAATKLVDDSNGKSKITMKNGTGTATILGDKAKYLKGHFDSKTGYEFNTLTVGTSDAFNISGSATVTVHDTITVSGDKTKTNLTVTSGSLFLSATDSAEHTVGAKTLTLNGAQQSDANVEVNNGTWNVDNVTLTKGKVAVNNSTLNVGGKLAIADANGLVSANASVINLTGEKSDLSLKAANTVQLSNTSVLNAKASDFFKFENDTITVEKTDFAQNAVSGDATSTLNLTGFTGKLNDEQLKTLIGGIGFGGIVSGVEVETTKKDGVDISEISSGSDAYKNTVVSVGQAVTGAYSVEGVKLKEGTTELSIGSTSNAGSLTLNNPESGKFVVDSKGKVADVKLDNAKSGLVLAGSGEIGAINTTAAGSGSVTIGQLDKGGSVTVGEIGNAGAVAYLAVNENVSLTAKGDIKAQDFIFNGKELNAKDKTLTVGGADVSSVARVVEIMGDVDAKALDIVADQKKVTIAGGAHLTLDTLKANSGDTNIYVGQDGKDGKEAVLDVGALVLGGATLAVDPDYGNPAALVFAKGFDDAHVDNDKDAGLLGGKFIVGQNSAVAVGFSSEADARLVLSEYLVNNEGFANPKDQNAPASLVANALVLNKQLSIGTNDGILVDPSAKNIASSATKASDNQIDIKGKSSLVITDNVYTVAAGGKKEGAAITFTAASGKVNLDNTSSIILAGDFDEADNGIMLFEGSTSANNPTLTINGGDTVVVKSSNGLLSGKLDKTTRQLTAWNFQDDGKTFRDASAPATDMMLKKVKGAYKENAGKGYVGYDYLSELSKGTSAAGIDKLMHAATYAGAQQAAVASVTTMAEAVGGRVGAMGVEAASIAATGSQANGGVWVTPMYKSVDADGFAAQGTTYGSDIDLAGVTFGADTVNGNMRFGAAFNIGSGKAEGKGQGEGLKDDFDYYGFGIYSAMGFGNFALVGDASLNVISHDVEGYSGVEEFGTAKGKADTTAVTMGVTGQYTISNPAVDVTPHVGARFIRLDTDSYDINTAKGELGTTDFDVQNVFSIPLGVTLSKAFEMGGWSLAPSADLTLTFNTGDTDVKSTTFVTGVESRGLTTEVLDEVTYGVAVGLGAQYGAFGTQIGINYTGSENTDSFGVNAQARYMF